MNQKDNIEEVLRYYQEVREMLDQEVTVSIETSDGLLFLWTGTDESSNYTARTMEYLQGLKHDTDKIIESLKKELES